MKKVGFEALIKKVEIVSLRSGDKGLTLHLEVDSPSESLLNGINKLHRADRRVGVAMAADHDKD